MKIIFEHNYSKKYVSKSFWDGVTYCGLLVIFILIALVRIRLQVYTYVIIFLLFSALSWYSIRKIILNVKKLEYIKGQIILYVGVSRITRTYSFAAKDVKLKLGLLDGYKRPKSLKIKSTRVPWNTFYINELDNISSEEIDRVYDELNRLLEQDSAASS